jgi:S-DNA-T family DNA segregation ATPase FtsK/SpoIIIE
VQAFIYEIRTIFFALLALISGFSLLTHDMNDPGLFHGRSDIQPIMNHLGAFGAYFSDFLFEIIGLSAIMVPVLLVVKAYSSYQKKDHAFSFYTKWAMVFGLLGICGNLSLFTSHFFNPNMSAGGVIGFELNYWLIAAFGFTGTILILASFILVAMSMTMGFKLKNKQTKPKTTHTTLASLKQQSEKLVQKAKSKAVKSTLSKPEPESGVRPNVALLDQRDEVAKIDHNNLEHMASILQSTLGEFGIDAKVVEYHPGPVVTRFEIELSAGTKVSKISSLDKDLARNLSVVAVRVVEVIAGKSTIGIELPNPDREVVSYRKILESSAYQESKAQLPLALGKDIAGHPVVVDLAKMPHLLVAGTTGSGKSVGLNAMLLSLLYKATPDELKLIMIDPKMLELSVYQDIGHLLTPVVTDMNEAASALAWCVEEMERRYLLMAALGVRNINGYNEKIKSLKAQNKDLFDVANEQFQDKLQDVELETLPHIVVVADEFADLIMVVGKKIEQLIARLAQKARASGIHIILATQRPSVDVITGLIKANIPTRIAFQVSSKIDSRTILDQQGAEQLLGHGDMLYLPPGSGISIRVHGAFVSDDEVHRVCDQIRSQYPANYTDIKPVISDVGDAEGGDAELNDPLYDEAVEFVISAQKVSVSSVQRRLRIGYNRAANLVEAMEQAGVVSPSESNGSRKVLVKSNA